VKGGYFFSSINHIEMAHKYPEKIGKALSFLAETPEPEQGSCDEFSKDIWRVCSDPSAEGINQKMTAGKGQSIEVGDIIKVGRIKFKIKRKVLSEEEQTVQSEPS